MALFSLGQMAAFIDLAKSFDLTALGQLSPETQPSGFPPSEIVMASGRPVLVIPYAGAFGGIGRRALIAWDGTRPCRGRNASICWSATVQQADAGQYRPSIERISRHLQRHGVAIKPEETMRGDLSVSELLLSRAADFAADLIVSGAYYYHHSQLREALLGGVTRELLEHMTVPTLLSH